MSKHNLQFGWNREGDGYTAEVVLDNGFKMVVHRWMHDIMQRPGSDWADYVRVFTEYELEIWNAEGELEDVEYFQKRKLGSEEIALYQVQQRIAFIEKWGLA